LTGNKIVLESIGTAIDTQYSDNMLQIREQYDV